MPSQQRVSEGTCLTLTMLCVEAILYSDTTKCEISSLKFYKFCGLTLRWSRFSKKLQGQCCRGAPTRPLMLASTSMRGASGWENSLHSLMLGYATLTQTNTRISPRSRFTSHTGMTKKGLYSSRVLKVEWGTFTPLAFTTTGGMSDECQRYHSRLTELLAVKKHESYTSNIAWITTRVSFAILRSALVCLRGSRSRRRTTLNIQETDLELEVI